MRITLGIFAALLSSLCLVLTSCGNKSSSDTEATPSAKQSRDNWLVSGQIASPSYSKGEVVALGMDGLSYRTAIADNSDFVLELPGNSTYALYFLPVSNIGQQDVVSASEFINGVVGAETQKLTGALLSFEDSPDVGLRDTLRLPKPLNDASATLSLGEIDIKADTIGARAYPTKNPASQLDFDYDGINDASDNDDQNDGLNDKDQNAAERIEVCHFTAKDQGKTESLPLSSLLNHLNHGDVVGPCQQLSNNPGDNAAVAPKSPLPSAPGPTQPNAHGTNPYINQPVNFEGEEGEEGTVEEGKEGDEKEDDADEDKKKKRKKKKDDDDRDEEDENDDEDEGEDNGNADEEDNHEGDEEDNHEGDEDHNDGNRDEDHGDDHDEDRGDANEEDEEEDNADDDNNGNGGR